MEITVTINGQLRTVQVAPGMRLLDLLRREGFLGVKHGCDDGSCGVCAVIVDGVAVNSCTLLAAQVAGKSITTIEGIGTPKSLHPLQKAFIETGAIQCGFCTPAQIIAAKALLDRNPHPTEAEVREALAGVLCRCTGYKKPVEAVLRVASGQWSGVGSQGTESQPQPPVARIKRPAEESLWSPELPLTQEQQIGAVTGTLVVEKPAVATREEVAPALKVVGKPEPKVDGAKLATGQATFTDDVQLRGLLYGKLLLSPVAHARIKRIDTRKAKALPGVHAVLTYQDLPRVPFTTAGQSYPEPGPHDTYSLDNKVRFVGDRVAAVAAETPEIAQKAVELIEVEYEELPAVFDPVAAMQPGAPVIHDEPDSTNIPDASRNLAAHLDVQLGDVEKGFAESDLVIENEYRVPQVQQTPLEPHVCITWWDEDDRLVVRTSTQVPYHVRRIIAPVLGLPIKRIRVIKPRIGGGFGVKQEVLIEDICAHLTLKTGRPVRLEYSRSEEFMASRSRHPMIIRLKTGVKLDGTLAAIQMDVISNTGAYGGHALTVPCNTGSKSLPLYRAPNIKFTVHAVYTNLPPAGAFRGYGVPQGFFAVESQMDEVAKKLAELLPIDPVEFRRRNWLRAGDDNPLSVVLGEGRPGFPQHIVTCGLPECVERGLAAMGKRPGTSWEAGPHKRRGVGMALAMHGSAIPGLDMAAASLKMNDDGSFNLLVGATDLGTGSDTILAQICAEVLGVPVEDVLVYSSDTDFTPFDKGAYASSTTYISGGAVKKVAEDVARQIKAVAGEMLETHPETLRLENRKVISPTGQQVTLEAVALRSLHQASQHQIMATASHMSYECPPPFAATFAEVEVDTETGQVTVLKLVCAVDAGKIINPQTAEGQIEGGLTQALGYAVCEEMVFDRAGRMVNPDFTGYHIFRANEMPELIPILVETDEPAGPFGAKAVAEIPMDGAAPAIANAVAAATGVRIRELPLTPERVYRALQTIATN